ncbi:MAG: hypothetical protein JXA33_11000 [Anaerolineae bacterium]|nr:hypothetical protein [Anaerolineae bacterium]
MTTQKYHIQVGLSEEQGRLMDDYYYLVARPWRRQLYLKGRNMTVGQVVATMQANALSPEEAAEDMDLPVAQVREALAYYDLHRDLVNLELREEATRVRERKSAAENANLPG